MISRTLTTVRALNTNPSLVIDFNRNVEPFGCSFTPTFQKLARQDDLDVGLDLNAHFHNGSVHPGTSKTVYPDIGSNVVHFGVDWNNWNVLLATAVHPTNELRNRSHVALKLPFW